MTVIEIIGNQQVRIEVLQEQLKTLLDANTKLGEANVILGKELTAYKNATVRLCNLDKLTELHAAIDDEMNPVQPAPAEPEVGDTVASVTGPEAQG